MMKILIKKIVVAIEVEVVIIEMEILVVGIEEEEAVVVEMMIEIMMAINVEVIEDVADQTGMVNPEITIKSEVIEEDIMTMKKVLTFKILQLMVALLTETMMARITTEVIVVAEEEILEETATEEITLEAVGAEVLMHVVVLEEDIKKKMISGILSMMIKMISETGIETEAAEEETENLEVEAEMAKIEEDIIEVMTTGVEVAEEKEEEAVTEMIEKEIDPPEMMNSDKVIKSNIGVVVEDPNL